MKYGTTADSVQAALSRRGNVPGAALVRAVIHGDVKVTLSVLERRFIQILADAGLPLPDTNVRVGSYRVDCRWIAPGITIELDSYRYHRTRRAWEQSHAREREARRRGDKWRRFTYDDVMGDPAYMLAELRKLLPAGGTTPSRGAVRRARKSQ